ncbi:MAG: exodeoxyribonuclease alpha subunit [Thermoanaerobacterium sp.]|nr:exodeoxyribonuclease alpha subunit [Thermoanaerobacterium sp.]
MEIANAIIDRIIYEADNFTVASVKTNNNRFVATLNQRCRKGQKMNLHGDWIVHKKYGRQFKVIQTEIPENITSSDIEIFLQNIKGIGPKRAKKIADTFGRDAIEIIEKEPARLKEIGIPESTIERIRKEIVENKEFNKIKLSLLPLGLSLNTIKKAYDKYKENTLNMIKQNPYRVAEDISGIGFIKADEIAKKVGIEHDNVYRIQSGLKYCLYQASMQGHLYLPITTLCNTASKMLGISYMKVFEQAQYLNHIKDVYDDNGNVYLAFNYDEETFIADKILRMLNANVKEVKNVDKLIQEVELKNDIKYADKQIEAIKKSLNSNISVITGGPGTGKTTIVKALLYILKANRYDVALASPTGKAAKRLEETTGEEAKTIHRLLECKFDEKMKHVRFDRNEQNPLDENAVIIDETSMIDNDLMYHLLKALRDNTKLILVGDVDQLPSVGAGNILKDIIESGKVPVTKLDVIFRQKEMSSIITNSKLINEGRMPEFNNKDFIFYDLISPEQIVKEFVQELKSGKTLDDIQILTPMKKTDIGSLELNRLVQEVVNPACPSKEEIRYGEKLFRVGDKVMQTSNNYEKEIFNGDTGYVRRAYKDEDGIRHVEVDFDGRNIELVEEELKEIMLAYAITVHKSQGSEYDTVIMPITTSHYIMLKRNLIYTGVTRAKRVVKIFGSKQAVSIAVRTIDSSKRYTGLKDRLKNTV